MSPLSEVARHIVKPKGITSTGYPAVRKTCDQLGLGFDEWQDGLGRLMLAKRSDGLYAADTSVISISRQVGKTYTVGSIVFALDINKPGLTAVWTAHRFKTARETFDSMQTLATRKRVKPHVSRIATSSGNEAIYFRNGSRILFGARERGFGRGFTEIDILVLDEGQILGEAAMDDMIPATNVAKNPLILIMGTPPKPTDPGEVFTMQRQMALDGESDDTLYVELSADRGCDPLDRAQWKKANPSYPERTSERAMLRMKKNLSAESFIREGLGIWDEVAKHRAVIKATDWNDLADVGPEDGIRPDALAVDMSHSREISVSACWVEGESAHVEEVWAGDDEDAAVKWIKSRVLRRTPVAIDSASPASSLIPMLRAKRVTVNQTTGGDMAKACGLVVGRAKAKSVTHGGQKAVDDALAGAKKRAIRDAGGWGWDRRDESVNIAPIVSWSLALFMGTATKKQSTGSGRSTRSTRSSGGREAVLI
jgi:hypothetical protein